MALLIEPDPHSIKLCFLLSECVLLSIQLIPKICKAFGLGIQLFLHRSKLGERIGIRLCMILPKKLFNTRSLTLVCKCSNLSFCCGCRLFIGSAVRCRASHPEQKLCAVLFDTVNSIERTDRRQIVLVQYIY